MMLFLLAFVTGLCSGLGTWAVVRMHQMYEDNQKG
jgi:cytochrome oxidase assembly protein ShyY1